MDMQAIFQELELSGAHHNAPLLFVDNDEEELGTSITPSFFYHSDKKCQQS